MHGGSKLSWAVHESWCGFGVNGVKVGLADFFVTVKGRMVRSLLRGEGRRSLGSSRRQGHVCNGEVPHGFWFHILAGSLVGDSGRRRSAPVHGVGLMGDGATKGGMEKDKIIKGKPGVVRERKW